MKNFVHRLKRLDTGLYSAIYCQLFEDDRRSLLALQSGLRKLTGTYCYLEIGSYAGGSLQPHVLDPLCKTLYAIDRRASVHRDDRGFDIDYPGNSSEAMKSNLRALAPDIDRRLVSFDVDAREIDRTQIRRKPDLCFIDGEHTEEAVLSDFAFCRAVAKRKCVICFHDYNIVFPALRKIVDGLTHERIPFEAYALPAFVFVIELGGMRIHEGGEIRNLLAQNWKSVLPALETTEHYREVYNSFPVRVLRATSRNLKRVRVWKR